MTHVFYLHSTICSIVSYNIIREKLSFGDNIVIILDRGLKFDFFSNSDSVVVFDAYNYFKGYVTKLGSIIDINLYHKVKSYKQVIRKFNEIIDDIIGGEDFILYTPNFSVLFSYCLVAKKQCKGYFFIEEGTLSYLTIKKIKSYSYNFKTLVGNIIRSLFGIQSYFQYKQTSKFIGTVASNVSAFPWNNKIKLSIDINEYPFSTYDSKYKKIVVTGYTPVEYKLLSNILNFCLSNDNKIAIKFHPELYNTYDEYLNNTIININNEFGTRIDILPTSFSVESAILIDKSQIISVCSLSSLLLYAVAWKCFNPILILKNDNDSDNDNDNDSDNESFRAYELSNIKDYFNFIS